MTTPTPARFWNLRNIRIINAVLVALMMACVGFVLIQVGQRIIPGWNGMTWIGLAVLISLEAYRMRVRLAEQEVFGPDGLTYYLVEWVVILVLLKLISWLQYPETGWLQVVASWPQTFLETFFNPQYLGLVAFIVVIYMLASSLIDILLNLENDQDVLDMEKGGIPGGNRDQAFYRLVTTVFVIGGGIMVFLAILDLTMSPLPDESMTVLPDVVVLMAYFVLGLILLGLARYSMKEAHWYLLDIPADPKVGQRWVTTAGLLLAGLGFLVVLLPTSYSLGLLTAIQRIVSYIGTAVMWLLGVIMLALALIYSFIIGLFGITTVEMEADEIIPELPPMEPSVVQTADTSWLSALQTVVFWVVFLGVIIIAFRMYIKYNRGALAGFKLTGKRSWLGKAWSWVTKFASRTKVQMANLAKAGAKRLRRTVQQGKALFDNPLETLSRSLPARQQVIVWYAMMVRSLGGVGIERLRAETPLEYARRVGDILTDTQLTLNQVTRLFIEARYSRHLMRDEQVAEMQACVELVRAAGRKYLEAQTSPENDLTK